MPVELRQRPADRSEDSDGTFFACFDRMVREAPERTAIFHYESAGRVTTLSYGRMAATVARRAATLAQISEAGELVFIIETDVSEQILWWLAGQRAGLVPGILTPPTPKLPQEKYAADLAAILAAHRHAVVVHGGGVFERPPGEGRYYDAGLLRALEATAAGRRRLEQRGRAASEPFIFQQSSGTTGLRKGVLLSEAAVTAQLQAYGRAIAVTPDDVIVSWLPLYHDMGFVACLLGALYWGLPLVTTSPFVWLRRPDWLFRAVETHGGSLCWLPNFAFNLMVDRVAPAGFDADALKSLRLLVDCSEPVLPSSIEGFEQRFAAIGLGRGVVSSSYAMAENTFALTQTPPGAPVVVECVDAERLDRDGIAVPRARGRRLASSGRVIPGTEVRIMHDGVACDAATVGEIEVRGDCLMSGYFGLGAERSAIDGEGWFRTGDTGYLRDGDLFVIGREKDIIIRAGRNIDPTRLEAAAGAIPGVKPGRAVAFAVSNAAEGTEDIIMIVESEEAAEKTAVLRIRAALIEAWHLEIGMAPQAVRVVPVGWLVKSSSGKISRELCRARYREEIDGEELR
ncbi:MAG: AMP-binding protein [Alphaproteobacteria bacterium]|jgi:acyl-CoA synthetase (AMP-forming)/AMP-acid ligase II|nr:AMP-binding protein [Alphaproteobacteria bacterium]